MAIAGEPISAVPISGSPAAAPVSFTWRGQMVDVDLVTRMYREDGTYVEVVNERRGLVKSVTRKQNVTELEVADIDRSALDTLVPSKTFTLADFPNLYTDHVQRPVPQVMGDGMKIPLTYVDNTVGAYRFIACEVLPTGIPVVQTIYRNGRIVSASEYSVDTVTVSGTQYLRITFVVEQLDFDGSLYDLAADILGPGSRAASDEIRRILQLVGQNTMASTFDPASLYCQINRMLVDCAYVTPRPASAIVEDLLQIARAWLNSGPAGDYAIYIDKPRDVHIALMDQADEIQIDEYSEPALVKTMTLQYRPSSSQQDDSYTGKLQRTTGGTVGETIIKNPYLRDHEVADRLLCYLTKREMAHAEAQGSIHGVQLNVGELVAIYSETTWTGWRVFSAPQVSRPANRNDITFREYFETIFGYTPGTLPADATNGYQPDYSQTPPDAPTSLAVVSQGCTANTDGRIMAFALVHALPPVVNWAQLTALITDTGTNEEWWLPLTFNAVSGYYEATFSGLRPNHACNVVAWATNSNNVDGDIAGPVAFTTANSTALPNAPASASVQQTQSKELDYSWAKVANVAGMPSISYYVVEEKVDSGSFFAYYTGNATSTKRLNFGGGAHTVQIRVKAVDTNGNESAYTTSSTITTAKMVDDSYILAGGVGTPSFAGLSVTTPILANTSVGLSKINTAFTINNFAGVAAGGTVGAGDAANGGLFAIVKGSTGWTLVGGATGSACVRVRNDTGASATIEIDNPIFQ